jgi:hypothetical protein
LQAHYAPVIKQVESFFQQRLAQQADVPVMMETDADERAESFADARARVGALFGDKSGSVKKDAQLKRANSLVMMA